MKKLSTFLAATAIATSSLNAQTTVTRAITDYKGFWSSESGNVNVLQPDTSHMLLGFRYGSNVYSTGVGDSILTANNVVFQPAQFQAFQPSAGTINIASATVVGVGYKYGGEGNIDPMPVNNNLSSYLTDGIQGLDLGTAVFNAAPGSLLYYINTTNDSAIADGKPDILVTQVGQPPATALDSFRFIDINGVTVGNAVAISVADLAVIGNGSWKFYNPGTPMTYNAGLQGSRAMRMVGFDFADFGLTTANISQVRNFVHRFSGESDQAFIAYNTASFSPSTGSPLPVALSSFTAKQTGSDALLQWNVTSAVKFAQFDVERSNGVAPYTTVGTVTYNNGQADYRFTDNEPLAGNNLYRLRLVDQDGKTAYSKIQKIDFGTVNNMVLYPNPCTDVINLRALEAGDIIHITNAAGVTMPVGTVNGSTVDVRHLANGIYTLSVYRNQQKVFATVVLKH